MDILNTQVVTKPIQDLPEEREEIKVKLQELELALISLHPSMPVLLQKIHKQLKNDPAVVTIMTEEDINILFRALEIQTNTTLMDTIKTPKKKLKDLGLDDI